MNSPRHFDVAIVGSGFAGSLLAWILSSQSMRVLLVDRQQHPRFAIGESSTPLADLLLRKLGQTYQLHELIELSTYASWKRTHPELACGAKRGFSYYHHSPGEPFYETDDNPNSLLVTASANDDTADTHWFRQDIDAYLVRKAIEAGTEFLDQSQVTDLQWGTPIELSLSRQAGKQTQTVSADFLVNASGREGLDQFLPTRDCVQQLLTDTQSTFGHFRGVRSWQECLKHNGHLHPDDPFDCDAAAQHHLTREGWLWALRFDNGIASLGWTRPTRNAKDHSDASQPHTEQLGIAGYPSLVEMLSDAELVTEPAGIALGKLIHTDRLQRFRLPAAGENWASLPTAVATLDPLHSTGIAHGMLGVQRLASALVSDSPRPQSMERYSTAIEREVRLLDRLVALGYQTMHSMERLASVSMLYFAAAIDSEEKIAADTHQDFCWLADNEHFVRLVEQTRQQVSDERLSDRKLADWLRPRLARYNTAGLLDPSVRNRYRYTAAPK